MRLLERLRAAGVDALVVTHEPDIAYLTGRAFGGEDSVLIVSGGGCVLVTDGRFETEAVAVSGWARVVMRRESMARALPAAAGEVGAEKIGVQAEHMTVSLRSALAGKVGARRLVNTSGLVSGLRAVKDESEVRAIRKAVKLQEGALERALEQIGPGMTETEAAAVLEYELKTAGASGVSFPTIMAARANGALPHARPGKTKLGGNACVLIDWGAVVDGYVGDMTRTFAFGRWPRKMRGVYGVVEEALHAGIGAVKAGATCKEVDEAARSVIRDAGYGERFGHALGHGIGLEVHEGPRLGWNVDDVLEAGMVVTVEPGVYLPGVGGVRLENDVVVTERGCRDLSSLPTDVEWATL